MTPAREKAENENVSILTIDTSFFFGRREAVGNMRPTSYLQAPRNLFQRHNTFSPQPRRDPHHLQRTFWTARQVWFGPSAPSQFLGN